MLMALEEGASHELVVAVARGLAVERAAGGGGDGADGGERLERRVQRRREEGAAQHAPLQARARLAEHKQSISIAWHAMAQHGICCGAPRGCARRAARPPRRRPR